MDNNFPSQPVPGPDEPQAPGQAAASPAPDYSQPENWAQSPRNDGGAYPGGQQPLNGAYAPGGPTAPGSPYPPSSAPLGSFFDSIRRTGLFRGRERWVGGVCSGLARRFDLDPVLVRVLVVVGTLFLGLGLLLYSLAWGLLPEEEDGRIHLEAALQGDVSAGFAGACAGTFIGGFSTDKGFFPNWYLNGTGPWFFFGLVPVFLLGLGIWVLVAWLSRPRTPNGARPGQTPNAPMPGSAATGSPVPPAGAPGMPGSYPPPTGAPAAPMSEAAGTPEADAATGARRGATEPMAPMPSAPAVPLGGAAAPSYPTAAYAAAPYAGPASPAPASPYQRPSQRSVPPRPVHPPRPVRPPRPRVLGPGRTVSLLALGLGLLVIAGCSWAAHVGGTRVALPLVGLGALAVILGLGIAFSGFRGRHGGWLSALGGLSLFALIPALVFGGTAPISALRALDGGKVSDTRTITWADIATRNGSSHELGVGRVLVDLSDMPADAAPSSLTLELGVGKVEVMVPAGRAMQVEGSVGIGNLQASTSSQWRANGTPISASEGWAGASVSTFHNSDGSPSSTYFYEANGVIDDVLLSSPAPSPRLNLKVEVGIGELRVTETTPATTTWQGQVLEDGTWVVQRWYNDLGETSESLPVPGTKHPAIKAQQSQKCIDQALTDSRDGVGVDKPVLGLNDNTFFLQSNQYEVYKQCVAETLKAANQAQPDATPSAAPSASATPSPAVESPSPTPSPAAG
ncbi:phage shock protein C [Actinomyces bovis]|uniref:Phage shock protein C n=1 Tax=Actinomyces bovis TaxID=1658 RepID=A0ABY1VLW1_9ACTO|nr:PspC domain-containing protein [Actinomyces bovis]SPT52808.1 phage shock protein C [Actinomyces bovis]VEG54854.1 phage shock protein C [Actinomyces israelii]